VSPLSEKWDLRLSKSRYNSKIASDRARDSTVLRLSERFGNFAANFLEPFLEIVGNVYESDYYSTMAGNGWRSEGRSNYGRVDMTDRNGYGRNWIANELRNTRRVCMKPQTKLDQRRNWGINLDLKTRWPETEKIRFDAPTQLYYWKEGMPTLRMFLFYFRFFFQGSFFTFFFNLSNQTNCFCWKQQFTP